MEGLLDRGGSATVREVWAFLARLYPEGLTDPFQRKRYFLTAACAAYDRLGDVTVSCYVNHIDAGQETQFCACVFTLPDGAAYIAFRGTDLTLAGWKEDLNMAVEDLHKPDILLHPVVIAERQRPVQPARITQKHIL